MSDQPAQAALWKRFLSKVRVGDECWEWTASRDRTGYGRFSLSGKPVASHRVAYELLVGPIPLGLTIDHLCRNRSCQRPDHLEPVTNRENILRGTAPPALQAAQTACIDCYQGGIDYSQGWLDALGWVLDLMEGKQE